MPRRKLPEEEKMRRERERRRAYKARNREKINAESRRRAEELSDCYVAACLGMSVVDVPEDMLKAKRAHLKLKRLALNIRNEGVNNAKEK